MIRKIKNVLMICLLTALAVTVVPPVTAHGATYSGVEADFAIPVTSYTTVPSGYTGIYTTADLDNIRNNLSGKYILMNDIVFTDADFQEAGTFYNGGNGWIPIGYGDTSKSFSGILDGNGYKISGIKAKNTSSDENIQIGLVGKSTGQIINLAMDQLSFKTAEFGLIGAIAATNEGLIKNCITFGAVTGSNAGPRTGSDNTGGGICAINRGTISFSKNYCSVITCGFSGGIVGNNFGKIVCCANFGQITVTKGWDLGAVGGIAGFNQKTVSKCYNTGTVIGLDEAGGIVGVNNGSTEKPALIENCFNTGHVKTTRLSSDKIDTYAAGIAALNDEDGRISTCYSIGLLTGTGSNTTLGGISGYQGYKNYYGDWHPYPRPTHSYYLDTTGNNDYGIELSYSKMASQGSYDGFDFSDVWMMSPTLKRPVLQDLLPDTYTINYELNGGSLSSSAPTAYMDGSNRILPIPAKEGYTFKGWYEDSTLSGDQVKVIPESSIGQVQYYAKWVEGASTQESSSIKNNNQNISTNSNTPNTSDGGNNGLFSAVLIISFLLMLTIALTTRRLAKL